MNSDKIVFLVGRENWLKDNDLTHIIVKYLKRHQCKIVWEDPAGNLLYNFSLFQKKIIIYPHFFKNLTLKLIRRFYCIFNWKYINYIRSRKNPDINFHLAYLKNKINQINKSKNLVIISRSAGSRHISLIADQFPIKHHISLAYPFKHPLKQNEPERYFHLETVKTPTTIFQGIDDEYGGLDVLNKYKFSSHIEFHFLNTNHNFNLNNHDWDLVLSHIQKFLS